MMDLEFGSNSSCVILTLMGLDERPIKKLVQGHKRVLSDEYHQRVASTTSHVRCSSFKHYSFGMSKNHESSEASVAICQNKRCKTSTEEESDVLSDERNALGGKGFVDELISETYSSHNTTRHYFEFVNSSKPSTSFTGRYSFKGSLGNSYMGGKDGNYTAYLLKNHNGRPPYSRSSSASSVVYRRRDSEKRNETLHQRSFTVSNALHRGEVDGSVSQKSNQDGGPLVHDKKVELFPQKSPAKISSMLEMNRHGPLYNHAIEQETSPKVSADSFYTDGSSIEVDSFKSFEDNYLHSPDSVLEPFDDEKMPNLSEHGTHLHAFGFTTSTARSGETRTTASADEDSKDHCGTGYSEQDRSKPMGISGNREFNYLVDILTAAGFCRKDLASSLDKWDSVESPLSPFIFETVEKRYADDKSWEMSERLLLFDRINSRLEGILRSSMLVSSRHVSARISHQFRQLGEDVLWSSLVKEARELKGETIEDLLESDLGSLDVGKLIESIVTEIERAVINELAAELVEY